MLNTLRACLAFTTALLISFTSVADDGHFLDSLGYSKSNAFTLDRLTRTNDITAIIFSRLELTEREGSQICQLQDKAEKARNLDVLIVFVLDDQFKAMPQEQMEKAFGCFKEFDGTIDFGGALAKRYRIDSIPSVLLTSKGGSKVISLGTALKMIK